MAPPTLRIKSLIKTRDDAEKDEGRGDKRKWEGLIRGRIGYTCSVHISPTRYGARPNRRIPCMAMQRGEVADILVEVKYNFPRYYGLQREEDELLHHRLTDSKLLANECLGVTS